MKLLFTLLAGCFSFQFAAAQYCGNSGSSICNSTATLQVAGFTPSEDIPCIYRNKSTNTVIEFRALDSLPTLPNFPILVIDSTRIDSIENLPWGLCWSSNKADNIFMKGEHGCIKISGNTAAPPGIYKLNVVLSAGIGSWAPADADASGMRIFLRVIDSALSVCPPIDTMQTDSYVPLSGSFNDVAQITGKVFYDQNQNGVYDSGDMGVGNQLINVGSYVALTTASGNYTAYIPVGNYSIQPAAESFVSQFSYSPSMHNVNVSAVGSSYPNNNFAVTIPPGVCKGSLSITSLLPPPRPGFENEVVIRFHNQLSSAPVSQIIRMFYSPHQNFVSASPLATNVDTAMHMLEWQVTNVAIGTAWQAVVTFQTPPPPAVPINTVLVHSASIVNSSCSSLDTLQTRQELIVVGSWDPNDKAVSPIGVGTNNGVLPNTPFTYTVRFQNTGTYLAEKVEIIDTISPHLNLATLQVTAASHNYEVSIENNRAVKFIFNNIMLPDSFSNEPGSHGYIQYSIKLNSNTANGSVITNRADIYFDFNPPILTNTVSNTIDESVSIGRELSSELLFTVYPNPNSEGLLHIQADKELLGEKLQLTDLSGKLLYEVIIQQERVTINLPSIANGVYLLKAGNTVKKLLKQ